MSLPSPPRPTRLIETVAGEVMVFGDRAEAARAAADHIAATIRSVSATRGRCVLGLATGATPIAVYERLAEWHATGGLSFRDVITYNLDEYYPIAPLDRNSYRRYMHEHLLGRVDIAANRAHVLDGTVPESAVDAHCAEYERWIEADGGIDLQLLGIGRNGHIGFNEPSELDRDAALRLRTRLVRLHPTTAEDAARDFDGDVQAVPRQALTMGTATILGARSILVLAFGAAKRDATLRALRGPLTMQLPASLLQSARARVLWLVDEAALG